MLWSARSKSTGVVADQTHAQVRGHAWLGQPKSLVGYQVLNAKIYLSI